VFVWQYTDSFPCVPAGSVILSLHRNSIPDTGIVFCTDPDPRVPLIPDLSPFCIDAKKSTNFLLLCFLLTVYKNSMMCSCHQAGSGSIHANNNWPWSVTVRASWIRIRNTARSQWQMTNKVLYNIKSTFLCSISNRFGRGISFGLPSGGYKEMPRSVNENSCDQYVTWSPNKLWKSNATFNLWLPWSYTTEASTDSPAIILFSW
jgi:hypothetical protein